MTLKTITHRDAAVAIWSGVPTLADCDESMRVAQACYAHAGAPVALFVVLTPDVAMPSASVWRRMQSSWPELAPLASTIQYVVLRDGGESPVISMLLRVLQLALTGQKIGVHDTVESSLREAWRVAAYEDRGGVLERLIEAAIQPVPK